MLRAPSCPVLVSSILLAPFAYGSSLHPGPYGSTPNDKSFILTFDSSAAMRSSYVVDGKGFYENGLGATASGTQVGVAGNNDSGDRGFGPASVLANALASKGTTGGTAGSFSGVAGFLSSAGGINSIGSVMGGAESAGFKGLGGGAGVGAGNKGLDLSHVLLSSGPGLAPGSEGVRDVGGASVSATPLPTSWTMMFTGLAAFGLLAWFRKPRTSENRPRRVSLVAE